MLVWEKQILYFGKERIELGTYTMLYVGNHNNMKKGAFQQLSWKRPMRKEIIFHVSLRRKNTTQYIWEELHVDQDVIDRVEQLTRE